MRYAYIGIFSAVFEWVMDKILAPVFNFVASLLKSVLGWLFNNILAPILTNVFKPLLRGVIDMVLELLGGILYSIFASVLRLVDTVDQAFDYMIGLANVQYMGKPITLTEAMFQVPGLRNAFLMITAIGLTLALALAAYATAKSALDLDFENKRPVSRVLSSLFRCFLNLLTVDVFVLAIIKLSAVILSGMNEAVSAIGGQGKTSLSRIIFVVASMNAAKQQDLNLNGASASKVGIDDAVRSQFYKIDGKPYWNSKVVGEYFNFGKFDYLIGFFLAIFLLIILGACLVVFVQRIYDMLALYLVSPLFIGMMPLDDGEKFAKWREVFIGKTFSGFGMALLMKLYIMFCPLIMSGNLSFSAGDGSLEMNYLCKMVFILGGAWSVLKSGSLITTLLSAEAGRSEQATANTISTYGMSAAMTVGSSAWGMGQSLLKGNGNAKQAFEGTKFHADKTGKIPGIAGGSLSGGSGGASESSSVESSGGGHAFGGGGAGSVGTTGIMGSPEKLKSGTSIEMTDMSGKSETDEKSGKSGSLGSLGNTGSLGKSGGSGKSGGPGNTGVLGKSGKSGGFAGTGTAKQAANLGGTGIKGVKKAPRTLKDGIDMSIHKNPYMTYYRRKDGTGGRYFAPGKGKLFKLGKDENGNKNLKIFGFGLRWGKDGKLNKVSMPFMNFKRNQDGKMNVSKLKLGAATYKTNSKTGKLVFAESNLLGWKREADKNGNYHTTSFLGGAIRREQDDQGKYHYTNVLGLMKQEKQEDGKFHISSLGFGAVKNHRTLDADGKLRYSGVRALGFNLYIRPDVIDKEKDKLKNKEK